MNALDSLLLQRRLLWKHAGNEDGINPSVYFLIQMSRKCTEILTAVCQILKESQHRETFDSFTLVLFNPASKVETTKTSFCGNMPGPAV